MSEFNTNTYTQADDGLRNYMLKVFTKMGLGLVVTTVVAFLCYLSLMNGGFMLSLISNSIVWIVLLVAQFGFCIALSAGITRFSPMVCELLFYAYAAVTGITFSVLPASYGIDTIFTAFLFAAVLYGCCVVIGHTTHVDLSKFSGLLVGALLALVVTTVLSIFIPALRNSLIISYAGVIIFLAYTAWDTQKIKAYYYSENGYGSSDNLAIYGAFQLYLDFINLFLYILQILGHNSSSKD